MNQGTRTYPQPASERSFCRGLENVGEPRVIATVALDDDRALGLFAAQELVDGIGVVRERLRVRRRGGSSVRG